MPCYDPRSHEAKYQHDYKETFERDAKPIIEQNKKLATHNKALNAALCAMFHELERRGIAAEVAAEASRNGLIDLMGFWAEHSKEDEMRLAKELHQYSKDEQEVLRKLLG